MEELAQEQQMLNQDQQDQSRHADDDQTNSILKEQTERIRLELQEKKEKAN